MSSREEKHSKESLIQDEKQRDGVQRHTTAFYLAIAAVCISFLMSSIDTVIVASALPRIAEALHASSIETYWCGTGFLYAQAVAQPIYGTFIGIVGAKYCIMAAMSVFLVASIFCAAAQSITWLITARVVSWPRFRTALIENNASLGPRNRWRWSQCNGHRDYFRNGTSGGPWHLRRHRLTVRSSWSC